MRSSHGHITCPPFQNSVHTFAQPATCRLFKRVHSAQVNPESPSPASGAGGLVGQGESGGTASGEGAPTSSEVAPDLLGPTDDARATSRSAVRVMVAHSTNPATRSELREEGVVV